MLLYDLAVIFYTLSFALLLVRFYYDGLALQALQQAITLSAIAMNAGSIILTLFMKGDGLNNFIALFTFILAGIYFVMSVKLQKSDLGLFILPVVILAGLLTFFLTPGEASVETKSLWLYVHIPLSVFGTALFITAFATGFMYVILERQLKTKNFGRIFNRFPPLATLSSVNSASLYLGFAVYTAGLITACGWMLFRMHTDAVYTESFHLKTASSSAAWFIMGLIVLIKSRRGMTARQTAIASVTGFISVLAMLAAVIFFIVR